MDAGPFTRIAARFPVCWTSRTGRWLDYRRELPVYRTSMRRLTRSTQALTDAGRWWLVRFNKLARLSRAIVRQASGPNSEPLLVKSSGSFSNHRTPSDSEAGMKSGDAKLEGLEPPILLR
jgi:hypothetical protein